VWNQWMDAAVLAGALPIAAQAYHARPATYRMMKAITPRMPWVDPVKDRQAIALALRTGTIAPQDAVEAEGYDFEETVQRWVEAKRKYDEAGLSFDYGWSARASSGPPPAAPPQEPETASEAA